MKNILKVVIILFINLAFSTNPDFYEFTTSHFARTIRLGNAYTGFADGVETVFYNTAGLANINHLETAFSRGQGYFFFIEDYSNFDLALAVPIRNIKSTLGLSFNKLIFDFKPEMHTWSIVGLHYAYSIDKNISTGITLNYYYRTFQIEDWTTQQRQYKDHSGNSFDFNLSGLYSFPKSSFLENDILKFGIQLQNILNTKVSYDQNPYYSENDKYQLFRSGMSYSVNPDFLKKIPMEIMFVFDAILIGAQYKFDDLLLNYGIELTVFNLLSLSFGRENEKRINLEKGVTYYNPQQPVNRYGFGLKLPVSNYFKMNSQLLIFLDYCYSDWNYIDESKVETFDPYDNEFFKLDRSAYSIKIQFDL